MKSNRATQEPCWVRALLLSTGLGFLFFHIGVHQAVGLLGGETDHTRNFGLLGVAFSISSFIGVPSPDHAP